MHKSFLPVNKKDLEQQGHISCDIIIITGDAYVDHPSFGAALIGRYLQSLGYITGIIAQPDWNSNEDFLKLGRPRLFVAITAGNLDSMLAHYTANKKIRSDDAYTPGNIHGKRPDRATIVYTNKVKQLMPGIPVVIGGLEASMRRLAHYDYWSDSIRKSILIDSKADILVYGMAEKQISEIAKRISENKPLDSIRGTVIMKGEKSFDRNDYEDAEFLPSFNEITGSKDSFIKMTLTVEKNLNPYNAKTLIQAHDGKHIILNPPVMPLTTEELDAIYALPFTRRPHPSYTQQIPAYEMIKDSITIVRGCPGGCTFCSLGLHQGKLVQSRSAKSILSEIEVIAKDDSFKGIISDLGGPSANVYKLGCKDKNSMQRCKRTSCLYPEICHNFDTDSERLISLLNRVRSLKNIRKVNISSGVRHDIALRNLDYIRELCRYHVPGHLKLAPESFEDNILALMHKPSKKVYEEFAQIFFRLSSKVKKKQYILPYLIASFPGCTLQDMVKMSKYMRKNNIRVEQVQDYIPLPMTPAAAMYYTEKDIYTGKKLYVAKKHSDRAAQKQQLFWWKGNK
jgi:uncharacterized radical SAM protein YgiQ